MKAMKSLARARRCVLKRALAVEYTRDGTLRGVPVTEKKEVSSLKDGEIVL
jgi:hypothetical protein